MLHRFFKLTLVCVISLNFIACSDDDGPTPNPDGTISDGSQSDAGVDGNGTDQGQNQGGYEVVDCQNPALTPASEGTCSVKKGSGSGVLLLGDVLAPSTLYKNGQVLIEGKKIVCVGCDCSKESAYTNATEVECARGVISPGLVNLHDHLGWAEGTPSPYDAVYDHRHEWRKGLNNKPKLSTPANARSIDGKLWGEIRHLMAGTTSIMGSGSASKLVRNVDTTDDTEGLTPKGSISSPTFPLGDSSGSLYEEKCDYKSVPSESTIGGYVSWVPHVAEGINDAAHNEFLCVSGQRQDGVDVTMQNGTFIHAVGINANDAAEMAASGTGVNWSARSNISLYGITADIVMLKNIGVRLSLGTDWTYSGSIQLLREMACVNYLNDNLYNQTLTSYDIWRMVTSNAADATAFSDQIGRLKEGMVADIAIYNKANGEAYEAVTRGTVKEVAMVMRGGDVLYGDDAVVEALASSDCETIDVCSEKRRICIKPELGIDLATLKQQISDARQSKNMNPVDPYDLFACGVPKNEPSCVPLRSGEFSGKPEANDKDGDGVEDSADSCPNIFNPKRPMNDNKQVDSDGDGVGDECDPCPFDKDTTDCTTVYDPDDMDRDGIKNDADNCPDTANPDQADKDGDKIGDVCDPCPEQAGVCQFTIKELRDKTLNKQPAVGTVVKVVDLTVTAIRMTKSNNFGFYVREGTNDYEAIFIYTRADIPKDSSGAELKVGDVITLEGTYDVYNDIDQLKDTTNIQVTGSGDASPIAVATKDLAPNSVSAEMLESHLVSVSNAKVVSFVDQTSTDYFWVADDGSDCSGTNPACTLVGDFFYDGSTVDAKPAVVVNDSYTTLIGVVNAFRNNHTLDVRTDADLIK